MAGSLAAGAPSAIEVAPCEKSNVNAFDTKEDRTEPAGDLGYNFDSFSVRNSGCFNV